MQEPPGSKAAHRRRPVVIGRLVARMRDWLAAPAWLSQHRRALTDSASASTEGAWQIVDGKIGTARTPTTARRVNAGDGPTVIQLPVNRRLLLIQLAQDMRARFRDVAAGEDDDPLLLTLSSGSTHRLSIDSTAHLDVCDGTLPYRVVLGDELTTRIILETSDFTEASHFVLQYLLLTRDEAGSVGSAA